MKTMVPPARNPVASVAFILLHFLLSTSTLTPCNAFTTLSSESTRFAITPATRTSSSLYSSNDDSFVDKVTKGYESFQSARGEGYDFKQSVAIALAGDYDADSVKAKIQEDIASAPCVMFTWEASPACKKAIKYLDIAGASYKIVRLDDPWSEGNAVRAELGKMVGRSSVPCIFIGGNYVGGFDGGVGEDSPGILELAFKGTLGDKLKDAGAML